MRLTPRGFAVRRRSGRHAVDGIAVSPSLWGVNDTRGWGPQLEPERVLTEVAALGETAIEAGPAGFLPDRSDAARRLLKQHRLRAVAGPVRAVLHHEDLRDVELAHIDGHAAWLASIGAETLVLTVIGSRSDGDGDCHDLSSTQWAHLLNAIGSVQHVCTVRGLRLAVQPREGSLIQGPSDIERLLVGSEAALCIDIGHLYLAGADPVEVVELASGRISHVHVTDVDRRIVAEVRRGQIAYAAAVARGMFKPLGRGDGGVSAVVEALHAVGYRGWYGLEADVRLDSVNDDPVDAVKKSLELLHRLVPLGGQGRR